nr:hypothetical protein [uncultured Flavobacterium sp.]
MKYYDIHVNDSVNSYSTFMQVKSGLLPDDAQNEEIVGHAVDIGKLDPDDIKYVDNVTEISEEEYNRAMKASK